MKQICHLDTELESKILKLEDTCQEMCFRLHNQYQPLFDKFSEKIILEVIRSIKGKNANQHEIFEENYESYIELGIEVNGEYFPNAYIPLWKCKNEWFEKIGYLTRKSDMELDEHLKALIIEMVNDREQSERE